MKCWFVEPYKNTTMDGVYVTAETRAKARYDAMNVDDSGWLTDVGFAHLRALRAPAFDDGFTYEDLIVGAHAWIYCTGCEKMVGADAFDGGDEWCPTQNDSHGCFPTNPVFDGLDVYCCPECRAHALARDGKTWVEPKPAIRLFDMSLVAE